VNATAKNGVTATALLCAILEGYLVAARVLLDAGAELQTAANGEHPVGKHPIQFRGN